MSQANVEIVRRSITMFLSGDVEGAIETFADPKMEFVSRFGAMDGRTYTGGNEFPRYFADIAETWERYERDLEEVIDGGDAVVAVLKITAVSKATGLEVNERVGGHLLARGRAHRAHGQLPTVPEALESAGISG